MKKKLKIPTDASQALTQNPFESLNLQGLPPGPSNLPAPPPMKVASKKAKDRGRLDLIRNTAHRGGKTVVVIQGFKGINPAEISALAKKIQKSCGTGGTVKNGTIEIQGDMREEAARILKEAGFKPVFAGG